MGRERSLLVVYVPPRPPLGSKSSPRVVLGLVSSDTKPHELGHRYTVTPTRRVAPNSSTTRPRAVLLRAPRERLLACRLALLLGSLRASRMDAAALLDDHPVRGARKIKPGWPAARNVGAQR